jgi:transposase-like protein
MDDDLTTDEARTKVELVKALVGTVWTEVADLFRGRAWLALGYASWDDLCVAEFDGARIRLPREDRREIVGSLREAGLSVRAIAAATGVAPATVHDDLSGVQNRTPGTTGTDGKRYPASRPAPPPEPPDVPAAAPTAAPPGPPAPAPVDSSGAGAPEPEPSPALTDWLAGSQELKDAGYVHSFMKLLARASELSSFDAERLGLILDSTEADSMERFAATATRFAERMRRARAGLRVIEGGRK